jgi:dTDP-4-dehydrorhamnose reductase
MTWLVLGSNGQLGQELINLLKTRNIEAIGTDQKEIDFTKPNEIAEKLKKLNPSHIVNCGAYTQVDKAEEEPELANLINAQAVGVIAKIASEGQIPFVHISTDYVFDGTATSPYLENEKVNPKSVYGSSKALGEKETIENNSFAYILRTAWVYGEYGNNFPKVIAKKLKNNETESITINESNKYIDISSAYNFCDGFIKIVELGLKNDFIFSSGRLVTIRSIVEDAIATIDKKLIARVNFVEEVNLAKPIYGDITMTKKMLDWKPDDSIRNTLLDMLG